MEERTRSMRSETAEECRTLDNLLYLLSCEWHIPTEKMAGRRASMLVKIRQLGLEAMREAVAACINDPQKGDFCPPTAKIATYAPAKKVMPEYCGNCIDGWMMVPDYEARRLYGNDTAMAALRCQCRRAA